MPSAAAAGAVVGGRCAAIARGAGHAGELVNVPACPPCWHTPGQCHGSATRSGAGQAAASCAGGRAWTVLAVHPVNQVGGIWSRKRLLARREGGGRRPGTGSRRDAEGT
jgi:hypothetical protein